MSVVDMVVDALVNILVEIVFVFAGIGGVKVVPVIIGFDIRDDERGSVVAVLA